MKQLLSLLLLIGSGFFVHAQEGDPMTYRTSTRTMPIFSVNGNFQVGIPMDAFRDNLDATGFGGGILALANLSQSPISAGLELSIMGYDNESLETTVQVGGFTKDYKLTTSANIFLGHAVVRVQPFGTGFITPYVDGMIGFKNLFTNTTLTDQDSYESVGNGIDQSDWALSYGAAFGLQIHFSHTHQLALDLRCAYLPGNNASYLVRAPDPIGGFEYDDPIEAFEKKNSPTNLLMPQIGVTYKFWNNRASDDEIDN